MSSRTFFIFLGVLLIFAVMTRETFIFLLLYFFSGTYLLGNWWVNHSLKSISISRKYTNKAFPGETIPVELNLSNKSLMPALWLHLSDIFPSEIASGPYFEQVLSLGSNQSQTLKYNLLARKRGFYTIGPFKLTSGDLLGLIQEKFMDGVMDNLTVYPRVVPLSKIILSSQMPMGTIKHQLHIFEDPNRVIGKREYQSGDSMRQIDWKSTASTGHLQVKKYEPTISLETAVFLNLDQDEYDIRERIDTMEFSIVTAASIINWVIQNKQSAGLYINGMDPLNTENGLPTAIIPHKGRQHFMRILEILARVKTSKSAPVLPFLRGHWKRLVWGTTLVLISGSAGKELFEELALTQRAGINPVLILCGNIPEIHTIKIQAQQTKIPLYHLWNEDDLLV